MTHNSIAAATPRDLVLGSLAGFTSGVENTGPGIWLGAMFTDTARANGFEPLDLMRATLAVFTERGETFLADRVQMQIEMSSPEVTDTEAEAYTDDEANAYYAENAAAYVARTDAPLIDPEGDYGQRLAESGEKVIATLADLDHGIVGVDEVLVVIDNGKALQFETVGDEGEAWRGIELDRRRVAELRATLDAWLEKN